MFNLRELQQSNLLIRTNVSIESSSDAPTETFEAISLQKLLNHDFSSIDEKIVKVLAQDAQEEKIYKI